MKCCAQIAVSRNFLSQTNNIADTLLFTAPEDEEYLVMLFVKTTTNLSTGAHISILVDIAVDDDYSHNHVISQQQQAGYSSSEPVYVHLAAGQTLNLQATGYTAPSGAPSSYDVYTTILGL